MDEKTKLVVRLEMVQEMLTYIASGKHAEAVKRLRLERENRMREWERTERDEDLKQGK